MTSEADDCREGSAPIPICLSGPISGADGEEREMSDASECDEDSKGNDGHE